MGTVYFNVDQKSAVLAGHSRWGLQPIAELDALIASLSPDARAIFAEHLSDEVSAGGYQTKKLGGDDRYLKGSSGPDASHESVRAWLGEVFVARVAAEAAEKVRHMELAGATRTAKTWDDVPYGVRTGERDRDPVDAIFRAQGTSLADVLAAVDALDIDATLAMPRKEQRRLFENRWGVFGRTHRPEVAGKLVDLSVSLADEISAEKAARVSRIEREKLEREQREAEARGAITAWAARNDKFARAVAEGYDVVPQADDEILEIIREAMPGGAVFAEEGVEWEERTAPKTGSLDLRAKCVAIAKLLWDKIPACYEVEVLRVMRVTAPGERDEDGGITREKFTGVVIAVRDPLYGERHIVVRAEK